MIPLANALDHRSNPLDVFFRDDDAGWAMPELGALLQVFGRHECPVDLAVIPAAIDHPVADRLNRWRDENPRIGLHQHGYCHVNHEPAPNRKCEFGDARPVDRQCADIMIGRDRMTGMLGETDPIFTPPWNRCAPHLLPHLADLGFAIFSDDDADCECDGLALLPITLDWDRARREQRLEADLAGQLANATRPVGIMLHHATLDDHARALLGDTLDLLAGHAKVCLRSMRHWMGDQG